MSDAGDSEPFLAELDRAGVRGRGGGGYPTAHKWFLAARGETGPKHFVCNANAHTGDRKVPYLLALSPHAVLEAVAVGAVLSGASEAYLALPADDGLTGLYERAVEEALEAGLLAQAGEGDSDRVGVALFRVPAAYIAGEESALLEAIEGNLPVPRRKPPVPTSHGLFGRPTVVNNLETVLQAALALEVGADAYRAAGTADSPGTMVFSLEGSVERPGLYELPLGTPLAELIGIHGGGVRGGELKMVFPGGWASAPVPAAAVDGLALDFDTLRDAGTDLGSGQVLVISDEVAAPSLARDLAAFFHEASCGKCRPCKDGTKRTLTMLERLDELDRKSLDWIGRTMPQPKRRYTLRILGQADATTPSGVSYTDMTSGLAKIEELCEFYKHRGDCAHSTEAATVIQRLVQLFRPEFEALAPKPAVAVAEAAPALGV